jgi:hypothetical protein
MIALLSGLERSSPIDQRNQTMKGASHGNTH